MAEDILEENDQALLFITGLFKTLLFYQGLNGP